jgi:hypothetical protein
MDDHAPDPRPTEADAPKPVSQADQSKFLVYSTLGVIVFIIFMSVMIQIATSGR